MVPFSVRLSVRPSLPLTVRPPVCPPLLPSCPSARYSAMIKDLEVLQRIKEERNKKEHNNYHFLMPREIPLSINI